MGLVNNHAANATKTSPAVTYKFEGLSINPTAMVKSTIAISILKTIWSADMVFDGYNCNNTKINHKLQIIALETHSILKQPC